MQSREPHEFGPLRRAKPLQSREPHEFGPLRRAQPLKGREIDENILAVRASKLSQQMGLSVARPASPLLQPGVRLPSREPHFDES